VLLLLATESRRLVCRVFLAGYNRSAYVSDYSEIQVVKVIPCLLMAEKDRKDDQLPAMRHLKANVVVLLLPHQIC
jgi:hypothetical protein